MRTNRSLFHCCPRSTIKMLAWLTMTAVSLDSSSGYSQHQRLERKGVCMRGCSKERVGEKCLWGKRGEGGEWWFQTLLGPRLRIKPKRKHYFLDYKAFYVGKYVALSDEMSGDMSAHVCVDTGLVLKKKTGPHTFVVVVIVVSTTYWVWLHVSQYRRYTMLEESQVILCLIPNRSPVLSRLKLPARCC